MARKKFRYTKWSLVMDITLTLLTSGAWWFLRGPYMLYRLL